jgi:hypothetical protein
MRKPLGKRLRFEVFKRDGFRCTYCGERPPVVVLVVDHVVPVKEGGTNEIENLTTSCHTCNAGKGAVPLSDVAPGVDEVAIAEAMQEMFERRMALAAHLKERKALQEAIDDAVDECRTLWDEFVAAGAASDEEWVRNTQEQFDPRSALNWIRRGMTGDDFSDALDVLHSWWRTRPMSGRKLWLCFCRICWDAIKAEETN